MGDLVDISFDVPVSLWHPKVRRLYEYWRQIHPASDELPGRQHFDPLDIPDLLPLLWILDVYRNPLRFRYRLAGTTHVTAMQKELKGRWMDEAHPCFLSSYIYKHYVDLAKYGKPSYRKGRARHDIDPHLYEMERVILPMARNGHDVDMLLAITVYYDRDGEEAFREPAFVTLRAG